MAYRKGRNNPPPLRMQGKFFWEGGIIPTVNFWVVENFEGGDYSDGGIISTFMVINPLANRLSF